MRNNQLYDMIIKLVKAIAGTAIIAGSALVLAAVLGFLVIITPREKLR